MKIRNLKISPKMQKILAIGTVFTVMFTSGGCSNKKVVNKESNVVEIPTTIVTIQEGDTLTKIAEENDMELDQLLGLAGNEKYSVDSSNIHPGDEVVVLDKSEIIGYYDIKPSKLDATDFVIYNVGNHKKQTYNKRWLKRCERERNYIYKGIIINSKANNEVEVYNDLEYAKSFIENYNIDLPVYLDINDFMNNGSLSKEEIEKFVNSFLSVAQANGMYVGIAGTSKNINDLSSYMDISSYDTLLQDNIEEYWGPNNAIINNNEIIFKADLAEIISEANKNKSENIKPNDFYVVRENDNLIEVARKYEMSLEDLLKYNGYKLDEKIKKGTVLRLPSSVQEKQRKVSDDGELKTLTRSEEYVAKGIDVSGNNHLPEDVNYEELAEQIDFNIIKISEQASSNDTYESEVDGKMHNAWEELNFYPSFLEHYNASKKNDIDVGIYYITRARSIEKIQQEAIFIVDKLKELNIKPEDVPYGIYIDIENCLADGNKEYYIEDFKALKPIIKQALRTASEIFSNEGYRFGVYCNKNTRDIIWEEIGDDTDNYEWYTAMFLGESDYNKIASEFKPGKEPENCGIWQVSDLVNNLAICGENGSRVDFDLCFKNYAEVGNRINVEEYYEYPFETKEFTNDNSRIILATAFGVISISSLAFYELRKRKNGMPDNEKKYNLQKGSSNVEGSSPKKPGNRPNQSMKKRERKIEEPPRNTNNSQENFFSRR